MKKKKSKYRNLISQVDKLKEAIYLACPDKKADGAYARAIEEAANLRVTLRQIVRNEEDD